MKVAAMLFISIATLNSAGADTLIRFKDFRFMQPGQDLTLQSRVENTYQEGYGQLYFITFSGATCAAQAEVPKQGGGVHVRDVHVDLRDGELTEQNGVVYLCTRKAPPQVQQQQEQQMRNNGH